MTSRGPSARVGVGTAVYGDLVSDTTSNPQDAQAIGGSFGALVRIVVGLAVLGALTIGLSIASDALALLG